MQPQMVPMQQMQYVQQAAYPQMTTTSPGAVAGQRVSLPTTPTAVQGVLAQMPQQQQQVYSVITVPSPTHAGMQQMGFATQPMCVTVPPAAVPSPTHAVAVANMQSMQQQVQQQQVQQQVQQQQRVRVTSPSHASINAAQAQMWQQQQQQTTSPTAAATPSATSLTTTPTSAKKGTGRSKGQPRSPAAPFVHSGWLYPGGMNRKLRRAIMFEGQPGSGVVLECVQRFWVGSHVPDGVLCEDKDKDSKDKDKEKEEEEAPTSTRSYQGLTPSTTPTSTSSPLAERGEVGSKMPFIAVHNTAKGLPQDEDAAAAAAADAADLLGALQVKEDLVDETVITPLLATLQAVCIFFCFSSPVLHLGIFLKYQTTD